MNKCVLCKKKFIGFGNNPTPLAKTGKCCDKCSNLVISARLKIIEKNRSKLIINKIINNE